MNIALQFSAWLLCICTTTSCTVESSEQAVARNNFDVRVLLARYNVEQNTQFDVKSSEGMQLSFSHEPTIKNSSGNLVSITIRNGTFAINKKMCRHKAARLAPIQGPITVNGTQYHGCVYFIQNDNAVYVINKVPLEEYVESVLKTEGWPHWPVEEYKVFAVTSRSFVLYHALAARKKGRIYDVTNTNSHQTYSGVHSNEVIKQAVRETQGLFLGYHGQPADTMYDACCGSIIPAYIEGRNFTGAPYLARKYTCTFCKEFKVFSWERSASLAKVTQALKKLIPALKSVTNMRVVHRDKAGIAQRVMISDHGKKYYVDGHKLYSTLSTEIKSFAYKCHRHGESIVFSGVGFGHHMGLCQWGAHKLARDGWNFRKILKFYYPGTTFMKLYSKQAS